MFGSHVAMGRPWLGYGEMKRMRMAQFIVDAYNSRKQSSSWPAWAKDHPQAAALLVEAKNDGS